MRACSQTHHQRRDHRSQVITGLHWVVCGCGGGSCLHAEHVERPPSIQTCASLNWRREAKYTDSEFSHLWYSCSTMRLSSWTHMHCGTFFWTWPYIHHRPTRRPTYHTDSPHCQTAVIKSPRQMRTRQLLSTLLGSIKVVVSIEVVPIDRPVLRLSVPCTSRNTVLLSRRGLKAKPCCYILCTRSLPVRLSFSLVGAFESCGTPQLGCECTSACALSQLAINSVYLVFNIYPLRCVELWLDISVQKHPQSEHWWVLRVRL